MREARFASTPQSSEGPSNYPHLHNKEAATQHKYSRPSSFPHLQNGEVATSQRRGKLTSFSQYQNEEAATQDRHDRLLSSSHHQIEGDLSASDRRILRAQYRAVKADIAERKFDPDGFNQVFGNVEHLYAGVSRPREQIADAEALFDITASLLASVKDIRNRHGRSASELATSVIKHFGTNTVGAGATSELVIDWERLGHEACTVFSDAPGMTTMIGPLDSRQKQRKTPQRRPRDSLVETARPDELSESTNTATLTDKNMETMFLILRRFKSVYLEELVLNRCSFAQTVENVFALSFLVKDGRAEISIKDRRHIVSPKNFPSQQQREQGKVSMNQFVFRFDFKDWQGMKELVEEGRELMPHREAHNNMASSTRVKRE